MSFGLTESKREQLERRLAVEQQAAEAERVAALVAGYRRGQMTDRQRRLAERS
jgi:hypothetical protein